MSEPELPIPDIPAITELSSTKCFAGFVKQYRHSSKVLSCDMTFVVFAPPSPPAQADFKFPVLYWLSGLTCNDQNFITKAGAQQAAAKHRILLVCPDTSPRGCNIEGETDSWDFGAGAGFYINATEEKWKKNYNMYSYITEELPQILAANFPIDPRRQSIFGHSMGGHGALIAALKNPGFYKSVSAFAPICHPTVCPWGIKAFTGYLGPDKSKWEEWDATLLTKTYTGPPLEILIDQGLADKFLAGDNQLRPDEFLRACAENRISAIVNKREGYDHSYYFIATFIDSHIDFHAKYLNAQ